MRHRRKVGRRRALLAVAAGVAVLLGLTAAPAQAAEGDVLGENWPEAIAGSYLVELKGAASDRSAALADGLAARVGGRVGLRFSHAMHGFVLQAGPTAARRLAADPAVARVMRNQTARLAEFQRPAPWGLDRIDQRTNDLDNAYQYGNRGKGVTAYVVDSGFRFDHLAFNGQAVTGRDFVDGNAADDCIGHGTHVASILGGRGQGDFNLGVAKDVKLVALRVTPYCDASLDDVPVNADYFIAAADWIVADHDPDEKAVANFSIFTTRPNPMMDAAVERVIADGVTAVVAAGRLGDDAQDACNSSPGRVAAAITVGATTFDDSRYSQSNYGRCVDIWAPGFHILGASHVGRDRLARGSGTSQAAPHVAGAAALVLGAHPEYTPTQVRDALVNTATTGVVDDVGPGGFNRLLYVANEAQANRFGMPVDVAITSTGPGGSVTVPIRPSITWGGSQTVHLSASAPAGVTARLSRTSVTAGYESANLTITLPSNATISSSYRVDVVGRGEGGITVTASVTVTAVRGSNSCTGTNPTTYRFPADGTAYSDIVITGCSGAPSNRSLVDITVIHPCRAAIYIWLYSPEGRLYELKDIETPAKCKSNVVVRGAKNLSRAINANGTWRLRVSDSCVNCGAGELRPWLLNLKPGSDS